MSPPRLTPKPPPRQAAAAHPADPEPELPPPTPPVDSHAATAPRAPTRPSNTRSDIPNPRTRTMAGTGSAAVPITAPPAGLEAQAAALTRRPSPTLDWAVLHAHGNDHIASIPLVQVLTDAIQDHGVALVCCVPTPNGINEYYEASASGLQRWLAMAKRDDARTVPTTRAAVDEHSTYYALHSVRAPGFLIGTYAELKTDVVEWHAIHKSILIAGYITASSGVPESRFQIGLMIEHGYGTRDIRALSENRALGAQLVQSAVRDCAIARRCSVGDARTYLERAMADNVLTYGFREIAKVFDPKNFADALTLEKIADMKPAVLNDTLTPEIVKTLTAKQRATITGLELTR